MPVKIACPKCSKKYTLPDSAVGKAVKCKACETTFRTRMPGGGAPASPQPAKPAQPTAPQQRAVQPIPVQPKPVQQQPRPAQPVSPNLDEFGIDDGFQQQADIFGSPPQGGTGLDNFADQDTFGEAVEPIVLSHGSAPAESDNPFQSVMSNSAMRGGGARKKPGRKQVKGKSKKHSAYGVVRAGMMCVFWSGVTVMVASALIIVMSILTQVVVASTSTMPQALAIIFGILTFLLLGLFIISGLVAIVGHVMCMFAPEPDERFNAIAVGVLLLLSVIGSIVTALIAGVVISSVGRGPTGISQSGILTAGIGYLIGIIICGIMSITATFLLINFYRRVGQNIGSDQLVKASNQAMFAMIGGFIVPVILFGLLLLLGMSGLGPEVVGVIALILNLLNFVFSLVIAGMMLMMIWTGIKSLG